MQGNQYFLLPPQPEPNDKRPRNAFGYLIGFGKAAKAYYRKRQAGQAGGEEQGEEQEEAEGDLTSFRPATTIPPRTRSWA